jgi:hypothetical protein
MNIQTKREVWFILAMAVGITIAFAAIETW